MPWLPHRLRDPEVWARVDENGVLMKGADGRVDVVYEPVAGAKVYRASAHNLTPTGGKALDFEAGPSPAASAASGSRSARGTAAASVPANAVHVWTDGGCEGNPGPAGLGVVIVDGAEQRELSEYLGHGTNNIAELTAILRGLESVTDRERPVVVYSDSQYSIGLLTQNWKAKANQELVAKLRALTRQFRDLRFVKVAAHTGIPLNERVDELARRAIVRGR